MTGWRVDNVDLWLEVDALLSSRLLSAVSFTKVKGHAAAAHIERGVISAIDRYGNHQADVLASAAAAQLALPCEVVLLSQARESIANSVPAMMVESALARNRVEDVQSDDSDEASCI